MSPRQLSKLAGIQRGRVNASHVRGSAHTFLSRQSQGYIEQCDDRGSSTYRKFGGRRHREYNKLVKYAMKR